MTIKIKCPVCNARNTLTIDKQACRRCKEDLSLLYAAKGYSYKYRLQLLRALGEKKEIGEQRHLAGAAQWFKK